MILKKDDLEKVYFITRTSLSEELINTIALSVRDLDELIYNVKQYRRDDLNRDWALFDFYFKKDKLIFAKNYILIKEKDIFRGSYIHHCSNNFKYLLYIIDNFAYCKRCDTQFFPKLWWDNPYKDKFGYYDLKYNNSLVKSKITLSVEYKEKLLNYGINGDFLNKVMSVILSEMELERFLMTKLYDLKNPPPASKIHEKLISLFNLWSVRPVKKLSVHPDKEYFFHKCNAGIERIIFQERHFYSWCPVCFTKFIPEYDRKAIDNYYEYITVRSYVYTDNFYIKSEVDSREILLKNSDEYFYLSILGFNERTTPENVISRFRHLSKLYHPDIGGDSEMFQKIVKAKEWLLKFYNYSIPERIKKEKNGRY